MFVTESEHKSAGKFAWFAAKDASMKSAVNASRFTPEQKLKAERVKLALELVYSCEEVKITNCKTWIRVKVLKGLIRDRKNLRLLESDWNKDGIKKVFTDQGIIYRVI
jgi:hypothetical protein